MGCQSPPIDPEPFAVWVDGWRLASQATAFLPLHLHAISPKFSVDLSLTEVKPIVLQGDRGLSRKGDDSASYYYSITRLRASGEIRIGERVVPVQGRAWFDREWSTSVLGEGVVGWDWFALQFERGHDMMLFQLRRADGKTNPYNSGLQVDSDGAYQTLTARDFQLTPLEYWRDERGVRWPVRWRVTFRDQIGRNQMDALIVQAAFPNQRMDTALVYWEGLVRVFDAQDNAIGQGYMELTGYR